MDFAVFLAPFDAGTFRSQYSGRQPLHIRRNGKGAGLLPWRRFNEVLAITPYWNEELLKVYSRSRAALRESYCDTIDIRPGGFAPVNPAKLKALMALGASLVADHMHRVRPEVGAVVATLEREFAARAFANVYCSFKGVQAFQTHFDVHDVFAVQAEGEKTWQVWESRGKLLFEAPMKPGNILCLPRGQYHDALTGDAASLARPPASYELRAQRPPAWYSVARRAQVLRRRPRAAGACGHPRRDRNAASMTTKVQAIAVVPS